MTVQRLRVLNVIPSLGGGGAERQVVLLAEALSKLEVEVHISYLHEGPHSDRAQQIGATMHRLRVSGNHDPRALTELLFLIRRLRPSVVQTWLLHADFFGGIAALLTGTPWVLSERASGLAYAGGSKNALRRLLGRHADAVVANSEAGLGYWRQVGYGREGLVIRNIVELCEPASEARFREGQVDPMGPEGILVVGRLADQKNPKGALDVLERVFDARPAAEAHFLGVGPMEGELREIVGKSRLMRTRVHFHGFVREVRPWYRCARVCLSMSRFEGTPNSVLEAMRFRCPLVVSDIPEHLELLDSSCAWLVPSNDVDAATKCLVEALSSPEEARRRSDRATGRLANYDAGVIAREYAGLYDRLSEKKSRAPALR
jgi:glycosyltransferase involved in cell wall biosynthesis